ncbi:hypothetical protein KVR01_003643 [Diaporthe batatas]|uniref:uncharacterized protein n=1 Tax=Diaporthe batatas TaxID=748121 RepID=UPI001D03749F|nr:uncharacterized protein KVR01_003643 [Diaporthe batatas]KAG8167954.1 hypothetical protein KVR01_003643 [Diaporthe batatas]
MPAKQFLRPLLNIATRTSVSSTPLSTSARITLARSFHSTLPKMTVHNIESASAFKETIASNPVVVVDWFATWCGPCKLIAPQIAKWSQSMPAIHFAKVDVDALPDLAQEYSVRAMPTFHIFKDGEKVDEYVSANPPALLKVIEKWKPAEEGEAAEEAKAE